MFTTIAGTRSHISGALVPGVDLFLTSARLPESDVHNEESNLCAHGFEHCLEGTVLLHCEPVATPAVHAKVHKSFLVPIPTFLTRWPNAAIWNVPSLVHCAVRAHGAFRTAAHCKAHVAQRVGLSQHVYGL